MPDSRGVCQAESYELRKAASTMTVSAIEWFRNNVTVLLEGSYSR